MFHGENTRPSNSAPKVVSRKSSSQGVWTSRNSSTQTAIEIEISPMLRRDWPEAAIATAKKTIVPHRMDPPYFTSANDSPSPGPNLRKARPAEIIDNHRQARTILVAPLLRVTCFDVML